MKKQKGISKRLFSVLAWLGLFFLLGMYPPASASGNTGPAQNGPLAVVLPVFKLPWPPDWNGRVSFRSGPHRYCPGTDGLFPGTYIYGEGSGIDFASGRGFPVAAMAEGQVVSVNTDPEQTPLGCLVAIRHDVGGTVLIYSHLDCFSNEMKNLRQRFLTEGVVTVSQGEVIGKEGTSGVGANQRTHLHLELRDGKPVTHLPDCDHQAKTFGSPVGWEILNMVNGQVDGYWFYGYVQGDHPYKEGATMYNYDGVAIKGQRKLITNFSYNDAGIRHSDVTTFVGIGYSRPFDPRADFEDNTIDPLTQFAKIVPGSTTGAASDLSAYAFLHSTNQWNGAPTAPDDGSTQFSGVKLFKIRLSPILRLRFRQSGAMLK